jgi:mannose-1-phosphate guanylyltransferase
MRHAVILAGGSGTRLWPASRRARPKQLLALTAENVPMVMAAATAIGLAAAILAERDPDAVLVVLPADQHVTDRTAFAQILSAGLAAAERDDVIATIGITPTRPETGFGYVEIEGTATSGSVVPVLRFVEKPDRARAEAYVASGRFLWNAGIFCATARRLLAELDRHLPATAAAVRAIAKDRSAAAALYPSLPSISFDHGIMEKVERVVTVPANVGWDDVGSWAALPALRGIDETGNTVAGNAVVLDGTGNVVLSDDMTVIATVGLSDLVVVKSGDAILVIRKDAAQDVRKVIDALSARGLAGYL